MTYAVHRKPHPDWRVSTLERRRMATTMLWFRIDDGRQTVFMAETGDEDVVGRLSNLMGQTEGRTPAAAMTWLNRRLLANNNAPIDALLASFLRDGIVRLAWAGMPAVYHRRHDGVIRMLQRNALPLGIVAEPAVPESILILDRGETLLVPNRLLEQSFAARRLTPEGVLEQHEGRRTSKRPREDGFTALIAERLDARPLVAAAEREMNQLGTAAV